LQMTVNEEGRPFLTLAERMGSFVAQMVSGKVKRVTVSAAGELVSSSLELMKAGVLKGILARVLPEPVNFINAPFLANEMGLTVNERREDEGENFTHLLKVRYETDQQRIEVAGTVFGSSSIRLVKLDEYRFEVRPEGHLLVYTNLDRPGMLAKVGSILARHNVNIAGVSLGRSNPGSQALTVMNLDSDIPPEGMRELVSQEGEGNVRVIRLSLAPS
jgi:D-3-phosphoglycerate dehydrogenase